MVAGSTGSPNRRGRAAALTGAALLLAACGLGGGGGQTPKPSPHPSPHSSPTVGSSPSPSGPASIWVIPPVGLRLHASPDRSADTAAVIRQGAQLDVTETRPVGSETWLHAHAHGSPDIDGWALNDPLLVTDIPMQQHVDSSLGYSLLFPANWTYVAVGTAQSQFTSADGKQKLLLSTADTVAHLPAAPSTTGKADHEEGPVDVYGKSPVITYYHLDSGRYELATSLEWVPGRAYQFVFRQQSAADSPLFEQMLESLIFT